jgi:hypothetical protein
MVAAVPTTEPARVVAGDSLHWVLSLADYPADEGWTLKYHAVNAAANFSIVSAASGADHEVTVAMAVTAAYTAGDYAFTAYVESASERVTLYSKRLTVTPNLATATALDTRGPAQQTYEALRALYQTHVTSGKALTDAYTIQGRSFQFVDMADLIRALEYWAAEAAKEIAAENQAQGLSGRKRVLVRFG